MRFQPRLHPLAAALAALGLLLAGAAQAASLPATEAKNGMVVTSQHLASQVGVDILKMGGNAIDAAVAVGYAEAGVPSFAAMFTSSANDPASIFSSRGRDAP